MKKCRDCGIEIDELDDFSWWEDEELGLCNDCYLKAVDDYDPSDELFEPDYPAEVPDEIN